MDNFVIRLKIPVKTHTANPVYCENLQKKAILMISQISELTLNRFDRLQLISEIFRKIFW